MKRLPKRNRLILGLAALLGLGAIGTCALSDPKDNNALELPATLPSGKDGLSLSLLQSTGDALQEGNALTLHNNGQMFEAIEGEIAKAKQSIHILVFIWRPSIPGERIITAISKRTREGVACRVVVDPVGSNHFEEVQPKLEKAGCEVHLFRPIARGPTRKKLGRNHRKLVVIDGRSAVTGGFGIQDVWLGDGLSKDEWRDTAVTIRGPVVRDLQLAFAEDWQEARGAMLPPEEFPQLKPVGTTPAAFVASIGTIGASDAERMYQVLFASARRRIWIANSYFTPTKAILDLLVRKAGQGVEVRVLGPGAVHDVLPILMAQRATYRKLLRAGVRIWEYQPSMLHSKTALIDDEVVVVGYTNLDTLSLHKLEEGSVVAFDRKLAARLAQDWERDLAHSKEIPLDWKTSGPLERAARRLNILINR